MIEVARTPAELRTMLASSRRRGFEIGFVPTMGALHDGHLSLVRAARQDCDVVVVSIFVNPLQFAPGEDLEGYPRNLEADLELLKSAGVGVVFHPEAEAFTPPGRLTTVQVRALTERLEGASRPTHFTGVTTIVTKLFNVIAPDRAYFGEKDFQQLAILRQMAADLDFGVEIIGCPIVREPDGLALSSRNAYLSAEQRDQAVALSAALAAVAEGWHGEHAGDAKWARTTLRSMLEAAPGVRLDYAEVCDPETLEPLEGVVEGPAQALVAAFVGATRLIDNVRLDPTSHDAPSRAAG
jgi:pantoate--beta-alanine ligase